MPSYFIHPSAHIDPGAHLGETTIVGPGTQIGGLVSTLLDVQIGANTNIFGAVKIGVGIRIGSQVTLVGPLEIKDNVVIGDGSRIGISVATTSQLTRGLLSKCCQIGKNCEVLGKLWIGEYARIQDQSRLEGDLPHHGLAAGSPAILKTYICECGIEFDFVGRIGEVYLCRCPACRYEYRIGQNELARRSKYLLPGNQPGDVAPQWLLASI